MPKPHHLLDALRPKIDVPEGELPNEKHRGGQPNSKGYYAGCTLKQCIFVDEYLIDLNATQAAIRAGYSAHTANQIAVGLMQKPAVSKAVAQQIARRRARILTQQEEVVRELRVMVFSDISDYDVDEDGTLILRWKDGEPEPNPAIFRAVESVKRRTRIERSDDGDIITHEMELKLHPKVAAANLYAKHLGMLIERIGGPDGERIDAGVLVIREVSEDTP